MLYWNKQVLTWNLENENTWRLSLINKIVIKIETSKTEGFNNLKLHYNKMCTVLWSNANCLTVG